MGRGLVVVAHRRQAIAPQQIEVFAQPFAGAAGDVAEDVGSLLANREQDQ